MHYKLITDEVDRDKCADSNEYYRLLYAKNPRYRLYREWQCWKHLDQMERFGLSKTDVGKLKSHRKKGTEAAWLQLVKDMEAEKKREEREEREKRVAAREK